MDRYKAFRKKTNKRKHNSVLAIEECPKELEEKYGPYKRILPDYSDDFKIDKKTKFKL